MIKPASSIDQALATQHIACQVADGSQTTQPCTFVTIVTSKYQMYLFTEKNNQL